jgi:hypothetical protein
MGSPAAHPAAAQAAKDEHPAVAAARAKYRRVLASWAQDLLGLRRRGLDRPGFRYGAWYAAGRIDGLDATRADAA